MPLKNNIFKHKKVMGVTLFENQTSVSSKYKNSLPTFTKIGVVIVSVADIRTYVHGATYESWTVYE